MAWLPKLPIVSLLLAVAFAAMPLLLGSDDGMSEGSFEASREEARTFLVRNSRLDVDTLGGLILDPTWLEEMRNAEAGSDSGVKIQLPARMLARSQARLDALIAEASALRLVEDPVWRFGVLDARSPMKNYILHAFVQDNLKGIILVVAVLLLVGISLERSWGSLIFSAFVIVAIPMTAQGYRILDASSGIPWSGGAGLAGALLGAYFIRGLGGHFAIPGWILLPAWLAVESLVVRGFWVDDFGRVPWATICAAVAVGALTAGVLRLANIESKVESRAARRANRGPNPVIARAARLRSDGDPLQAFDLIQAAWREDPKSEEIVEAFFSIAVEVGRPEAVAEAIVPPLRSALRSGDVSRAIEYWLPIATKECDVVIEATSAVRLGDALLDAGHAKEAIFTLRGALEVGVSSAQAIRIVKVARDLDDDLARRAAAIALNDASLDARLRAELQAVAVIPSDAPPPETPPETHPEAPRELDARAQAEPQAMATTAILFDADSDVDDSDPNEAKLKAQTLDAGAFSAENLSAEPSVDEPHVEAAQLDVAALEAETAGLDFGPELSGSDLLDPFEAETESDLTPMIDAMDELTSPLMTSMDDQSTVIFDRPATPPQPAMPADASRSDSATAAIAGAPVSVESGLRSMKVLEAVPIAMTEDWIEIDASPRGKSKLPFSRIQSLAVAAVNGLGNRPVLIVDVMLNGSEGVDEPLKLVRFRSDRFDPLGFEPDAANPLEALTAWVKRLQSRSNATCLPSRNILSGEFARFKSIRAYERDVLMAVRVDEG